LIGVLRGLRHLLWLTRIALHLAQHDALFPFDGMRSLVWPRRMVRWLRPPREEIAALRPGERLALALQSLGPSFIKLGQMLSTRSDLLGEQVAIDLSSLQDRLPPFPGLAARRVIETALGGPIDLFYQDFDDLPVAAASVAQVHFATTTEGRAVAVKVLRPGIDQAFARDVDLLRWLAEKAEALLPDMRRLRPIEVVRELARSVAFELDLRLEAAAASELAENFADDPDFRVPAVDWQRTGREVLTLERVHGIPVDEREALIAAGHDLPAIIGKAAAAFFRQVFRDGFFHADLHPGNLFVADDGAIVAIDFGIMGRLDRQHRYYIADMLMGFLGGDYRRVAEVHFAAGMVPPTESIADFTQACRSIGEPLLGRPLAEISVARLLAQLFQITRQFKMVTQPQLLMLQKTMVLAEGMGRHLDPSINMWTLAQPLIEEWMLTHRGPQARVADLAADAAAALERLPTLLSDLERMIGQVARGGLPLAADTVELLTRSNPTGRRLVWPLWIAALALAALALGRF